MTNFLYFICLALFIFGASYAIFTRIMANDTKKHVPKKNAGKWKKAVLAQKGQSIDNPPPPDLSAIEASVVAYAKAHPDKVIKPINPQNSVGNLPIYHDLLKLQAQNHILAQQFHYLTKSIENTGSLTKETMYSMVALLEKMKEKMIEDDPFELHNGQKYLLDGAYATSLGIYKIQFAVEFKDKWSSLSLPNELPIYHFPKSPKSQ